MRCCWYTYAFFVHEWKTVETSKRTKKASEYKKSDFQEVSSCTSSNHVPEWVILWSDIWIHYSLHRCRLPFVFCYTSWIYISIIHKLLRTLASRVCLLVFLQFLRRILKFLIDEEEKIFLLSRILNTNVPGKRFGLLWVLSLFLSLRGERGWFTWSEKKSSIVSHCYLRTRCAKHTHTHTRARCQWMRNNHCVSLRITAYV